MNLSRLKKALLRYQERPANGAPRVGANSYICPACQAAVDNGDLEAIRFHHEHVLHPRQDIFAALRSIPAWPNHAAKR